MRAVCLLFLLLAASLSRAGAPTVVHGVLDARHWDFRQGTIQLNGWWQFHRGLLLNPARAVMTDSVWLPGSWGKISTPNDTSTRIGTYRLTLLLPPNVPRHLAIRPTRSMNTALRISLDGVPQGELGHFSVTHLNNNPAFSSQPIFLEASPGQHELVIEASHYYFVSKGFPRPWEFGEASLIVAHEEHERDFNDFLIGSLGILALQYSILWWKRRRDAIAGFFSLICIFCAARQLTTASCSLAGFLSNIDWEICLRIEYITFGTIILWTYWLSQKLFPHELAIPPLRFLQGSALLYIFFVLAATPRAIVLSMRYYQIIHIILIVYMIGGLFLALRHRRQGAGTYLLGFLILAVCVFNDVFYAWKAINTGLWSSAGMLGFIASLAVLTSQRTADDRQDIENSMEVRLEKLSTRWESAHPGFHGHSRRVAELSLRLARFLPLSPAECDQLRRAALMHDIGMNSVPAKILLSSSSFDPRREPSLRTHPAMASRLAEFPDSAVEAEAILAHHEHWDGSGYPSELSGEAIPLFARIIAIADMWDALRHDRPHRPAYSVESATELMLREHGRNLDPSLLNHFLENRLWEESRA